MSVHDEQGSDPKSKQTATTIQDEQVTMLKMECGCEYRATHITGDRKFHCPHQTWIIRVVKPMDTRYLVEKEKLPQPTVKIQDLLG